MNEENRKNLATSLSIGLGDIFKKQPSTTTATATATAAKTETQKAIQ